MNLHTEEQALGYGRANTIVSRALAWAIESDEHRSALVDWLLSTLAASTRLNERERAVIADARASNEALAETARLVLFGEVGDALRTARFLSETSLSAFDVDRYGEEIRGTIHDSLARMLSATEDYAALVVAQTEIARSLGALAGLDASEINRLFAASDAERVRQHAAFLRWQSGESVPDDELKIRET